MTTQYYDPADIAAVGDELVSQINAVSWVPTGGSTALTFTARRVYFFQEYLATDTDLHVDLLIMEEEPPDLSDRKGTIERTMTVAIGVQKRLQDRTSLSEVDNLVAFTYGIAEFFELQDEFVLGVTTQRVRCDSESVPVIYSPDEIDTKHRFFAVVHLTFKGWF